MSRVCIYYSIVVAYIFRSLGHCCFSLQGATLFFDTCSIFGHRKSASCIQYCSCHFVPSL